MFCRVSVALSPDHTYEHRSSETDEKLHARACLQGEDLPDGAERQQLLLARLGEFAATAVPPGSGSDPPLRTLVGKLLAALAASEKFPVQLNPITAPPPLGAMYGGAYYRATGGALPRKRGTLVSWLAGFLALPCVCCAGCLPRSLCCCAGIQLVCATLFALLPPLQAPPAA